LHLAAQNGHEAIVHLLLENEANPNLRDKHTWTVLHYAAWRGYDLVVQKLIDREADASLKDRLG
jgi:ankyrin repeat protein